MHALSFLTLIAAAASLQLATAHSYMSNPPCFNCPRNHDAAPKDVTILSDPMKDKALCRGVKVPAAAKAFRVKGGNLEIEINAVKGHPGTCKFSVMDTNLKNPVHLATHTKCLVKGGRQTFSVPLKGATGLKVIRYTWDEGKEHYESCSLVRIGGAPKGKSKTKTAKPADTKVEEIKVTEEAEVVEEVTEPKLVPAKKSTVKKTVRKASAPVEAPATKATKVTLVATEEETDDGPSMEELDALFNGKEPAAPQEAGHDDDDDECTVGELECHGDGFRKCGSGNEWTHFSCGEGTTCSWIPSTQSVACEHED